MFAEETFFITKRVWLLERMHFKELQNWFYILDLKATSILYVQSVGRKEFSNEVEGKPATKPAGLLNLKQNATAKSINSKWDSKWEVKEKWVCGYLHWQQIHQTLAQFENMLYSLVKTCSHISDW